MEENQNSINQSFNNFQRKQVIKASSGFFLKATSIVAMISNIYFTVHVFASIAARPLEN
jgi:hypothetical protein